MLFPFTISLFYMSHCAPESVSWWLLLIYLPLLLFQKEWRKILIKSVLTLLMLMVFMHSVAMTGVKTGIPRNQVASVTVRVISDSVTRKHRKSGVQCRILYVHDRFDTYASGSGCVYAMMDATELYRGDRVTLKGSFADDADIFFARGVHLLERADGYEMRRRAGAWIRKRLDALSDNASEMAMLLLIGEGDDPTWFLSEKAREKGVSHVFALSGMHLSLLCSFLLPFLTLILGKSMAKKTVILPLLFFTYTSSWRPSLVRAFIFRAVRTFFDTDEENAFALTVILHGLVFPETLLHIGSMFSYLSVAALFYLVPKMDRAVSDLIWIKPTILTASMACLMVTAPLASGVFGSWSLSSLIYSPVTGLLVTLFMGETLLYLVLPYFTPVLEWTYKAVEWVLLREWGVFTEVSLEAWCWMTLCVVLLLVSEKVVKTGSNLYAERDVEP